MVTRLNLPARTTKDPITGVRSTPLPGSPAHDMGLVSAYVDGVLGPAIDALQAAPSTTPDPIEVSG